MEDLLARTRDRAVAVQDFGSTGSPWTAPSILTPFADTDGLDDHEVPEIETLPDGGMLAG